MFIDFQNWSFIEGQSVSTSGMVMGVFLPSFNLAKRYEVCYGHGHVLVLGGLSVHLKHLIGLHGKICHQLFGTLPF